MLCVPRRKRQLLEQQYEVQCLLARRCTSRSTGAFEYLVGWNGYDALGDTWEPESNLPKMIVKAYDKQFALGVELSKAALREHFYNILLDSKQGRYGAVFYLHEARDPQVAQQLLHTLAQRRSGPPLKLERYEDSENIKMVLELTSQEHLADLVLLHGVHPQHGLGNVRIRHGHLRDKDLLVVQMVLLEYVQPKPIGGRAPTAGYQFKVTYTTLKFNGATGEHRQPEGVIVLTDEKTGSVIKDTRLSDAQRDLVVEWVKRVVQEPWATYASFRSWRVKRHRLSEKWAMLPQGRWMLSNAEAMPSAAD